MTIAYSDKYKTWVSRYSFEPTCYSTIGNGMVSFNDNGGVWSHDTNNSRCNFYGDQKEATIQVCSNQDPSAVKIFKSISLETNGNGWSGKVYTNDEYDGNEKQEGDILTSFFKNKEGFKYAEMPRSRINSSTTIPLGVPSDLLISDGDSETYNDYLYGLVMESLNDDNIATIYSPGSGIIQYPIDVGLIGAVDPEDVVLYVNIPFDTVFEGLVINASISSLVDDILINYDKLTLSGYGYGYVRVSFNPNDFQYIASGITITDMTDAQSYILSAFYNYGYPGAFEVIDVGSGFIDSLGGAVESHQGRPMHSTISSEINGDQMRGPYSRIELSTSTDKPFELHAINVDYEFSKLDKRLTQNS